MPNDYRELSEIRRVVSRLNFEDNKIEGINKESLLSLLKDPCGLIGFTEFIKKINQLDEAGMINNSFHKLSGSYSNFMVISKIEYEDQKLKIESVDMEYDRKFRSIEEERLYLSNEISTLTEQNQKLAKQLSDLQNIKKVMPAFIEEADKVLNKEIEHYQWGYLTCYFIGICAFLSAIYCSYNSFYGLSEMEFNEQKITLLTVYGLKGMVLIFLISTLAYIFISLGNKFNHEYIVRNNRKHAIQFGKLFFQVYGGDVNKQEMLDAFKEWNSNNETAFSAKNSQGASYRDLLELFKAILSRPTKL